MDEQLEQLIETWNIHNRINLYVLDALTPEALGEFPALKGAARARCSRTSITSGCCG